MVERASIFGHDARVRTMTKIDYGEPANQRVERTAICRLVFDDAGNMNIDFQSWSARSVAAAHSGRSA
jgi:hypothetical protein